MWRKLLAGGNLKKTSEKVKDEKRQAGSLPHFVSPTNPGHDFACFGSPFSMALADFNGARGRFFAPANEAFKYSGKESRWTIAKN